MISAITNPNLIFFLAIISYIFVLFESYRLNNRKNIFATGIFSFVELFVLVPYGYVFASYFLSYGISTIKPIEYSIALLFATLTLDLFYLYKSYAYYLKP
jgi:hypothetical protein